MIQNKKNLHSFVTTIRRELHQYPELSENENKTAKRICAYLSSLGIKTQTGVAGHGILAEIPGQKSGPYIALRADMDALPIQEETKLPFSSNHKGVMHACGHDGHMAMVLGAAKILTETSPPPLPIRLIFQPAEEIGKGALAMIKAGALEGVAAIFGGHIDRHYKTATIMVHNGAVNASSDTFKIEISGKGGHGARPHQTIDAVLTGAHLVTALQTIVSREINPHHPAVLTVGTFSAGTAHNVISGHAQLSGTIRAQDKDVRETLHRALERITDSIATLHKAKISLTLSAGAPPLINLPELIPIAKEAVKESLGESALVERSMVNMGGEDFSYYLEQIPGIYVRIGAALDQHDSTPAHSSTFDFDEDALVAGASYFAKIAELAGTYFSE